MTEIGRGIPSVTALYDLVDKSKNRIDLSPMQGRKIRVIDVTIKNPALLPNGTIYGNYSYILPDKTKVIPRAFARHIDQYTETETGFTRLFMKNNLPKVTYRKIQNDRMKLSRPPLYIRPSILKEAVYVDLVAAYPSIYKLTGWQVEYERGKYYGVNDSLVYPYPQEWKVGRSFIVTGAIPRQFSRYIKDGAIQIKPYYSSLANPCFVAAVYDTLSMIAKFATYALDARYWNADGGILRIEALDMFMDFIESLGLKARIKYIGKALIMSSGYWSIGGHKTKRMEKGGVSEIRQGDYNYMSIQDAEWLYKQMTGGSL